jgi:hypothetical protein
MGKDKLIETQILIDELPHDEKTLLSDGYHSFNELYEIRKAYNAALFNEWAKQTIKNPDFGKKGEPPFIYKYNVHKSLKHNDDSLCFGGGWFIVCAKLPSGQISNHYPIKDWELFNIPIEEKAKFAFDGHDTNDVIQRLKTLSV